MPKITNFYDPSLYELELGEADDTASTIEFYKQSVGESPKTFLDIGAGNGRIAIPLLLSGHYGICIDESRQMLMVLKATLRRLGLSNRATLINERFDRRSHCRQADMALGPDDFLLHLLSVSDLVAFFAALRTWLPRGGRFVTDVRPRNERLLTLSSRPPYVVRNYSLVRASAGHNRAEFYRTSVWETYQAGEQRLTTFYRYEAIVTDGSVTKVFYRFLEQRVHRNAEIIAAARSAGFSLLKHCQRNNPARLSRRAIGGTLIFVLT
jgi:SAM-dependent methyltransferase